MTRINYLAFLTLLAFSTAACNGSKSEDGADTSGTDSEETTQTDTEGTGQAGTEGTDTEESTSPVLSGKTPSKIDFEIPTAIRTESTVSQSGSLRRLGKKVIDNKQSGAFKLLKEKISETDTFSNDIKIQFVLIDAVITEIQDVCESVAISNVCTIPANQISFNLDQTIIDKLVDIDETKGNELATIYESTPYSFNEILYTEYSDTEEYQYQIETKDSNNISFALKWSEDLTLMNALYSNDENTATVENTDYSHTYELINKVETITLVNNNDIYDFELVLSKLNDDNDSYTLVSSYDYVSPTPIDGYTKTTYIGEIDNAKGSLESSEYVDDAYLFNRSVEYFDTEGRVERSIYCDDLNQFEFCNYDDQSTWLEYNYAITYVDNIPLQVEKSSDLIPGANHFLFPSTTNAEDITNENIYELSLGRFYVSFVDGIGDDVVVEDAVLHDLDYLDKLDELDIYVINPMIEPSLYKIDRSNTVITVLEQ